MAKYTFKTTDEGSGGSYIKQAGRYTFKVDKIEDKFVNGHDVSDIHVSDVETGDRMKDSLHYTEKGRVAPDHVHESLQASSDLAVARHRDHRGRIHRQDVCR
jgi:hypothetical protein